MIRCGQALAYETDCRKPSIKIRIVTYLNIPLYLTNHIAENHLLK